MIKNLIYICFSGIKFFKCVQILIISIIHIIERSDIDIMITCSKNDVNTVKEWVTTINSPIQIFINVSEYNDWIYFRYELPEFVKNYDKCLYLDSDIIITNNNFNKLFDEHIDEDILYVYAEKGDYEMIYYKHPNLEWENLELIKKNEFHTFNNGQFIFKYSNVMKNHFNECIKIMKTLKKVDFIEQAIMNQYFLPKYIVNYEIFPKYLKTFANSETIYDYKSPICIYHFCGNGVFNGDNKSSVLLKSIEKNNLQDVFKEILE